MKTGIKKIVALALVLSAGSVVAASTYEIERAKNNREFVIDGKRFEALTSCSGFEQGDRVRFVEGNAEGDCKTAKIMNIRNGVQCELWCK